MANLIDDEVRQYRNGGCFAMAEALHRITGHPIRHIDFGSFVHAFVVTPENEVIDIHGKMPLDPDFLSFLVTEKVIPAHAVERGLIRVLPLPDVPNILWREAGYCKPSESAVRKAMTVARHHPNLVEALASYQKKQARSVEAQPAI